MEWMLKSYLKTGKTVLVMLFLFISFSCHKKQWELPPRLSVMIGFADTNEITKQYNLDSLRIDNLKHEGYTRPLVCYISNGVKNYLKSTYINQEPISETLGYRFLGIGDIPGLSADKGINQFLIFWPSGVIDTLNVHFHSDFTGPNNCSCGYPLDQMNLNGKPFIRKTDYDNDGVYIFSR